MTTQGTLKTEFNVAALGLCDPDVTQEFTQIYQNLADLPVKKLGDEAREAAAREAATADPLTRLKAGLITAVDCKETLLARGSDDLALVRIQNNLFLRLLQSTDNKLLSESSGPAYR
jgi:hypothetical protein